MVARSRAPAARAGAALFRHVWIPAYFLLAAIATSAWYAGADLAWGDDATHPLSLRRVDTYFRLLDPGLGGPDGRKFPFLLPLGGALRLWQLLHLPYDLTVVQPFVVVVLLGISASSMYLLVRKLLPRIPPLGAFGGGLFYAFNLYATTTIWSSMAYLCIHYALLPLVVLAWVWALGRATASAAILAGLAWAFALTPAYITTPLAVTDVALFTAVAATVAATAAGRRTRTVLTAGGTFAVWVGLSLFWLLPLAMTTASVEATGLSAGDPAHLLAQNSAPLLDALRLGGYWGVTSTYLEHPYFAWAGWYTRVGLHAGIAIPIAAALGAAVFLTRRGRARLMRTDGNGSWLPLWFAGALAVGALFLITGTHAPLGGLKREIVTDLGLAGPFRSVYQRFGVYLVLAYGPLVAAGIAATHLLASRIPRPFGAIAGTAAALAAIVAVAVVPAWPMWTGTIMDSSGSTPARRITIPSDYSRVAAILNETPGDFDVLTLPYGGAGTITLHWSATNSGFYDRSSTRGYTGIEPLKLMTDKGILTSDATAPYLFDWVASVVRTRRDVHDALRLLNARYVVLHLDENPQYLAGSGAWTGTGIRKLAGRLDRVRDLRLVYASNTLRVYAVRNWRPFRVFALKRRSIFAARTGALAGYVRPLPYREQNLGHLVVDTRSLRPGELVVVNRPYDSRWTGNGGSSVRVSPGLTAFRADGAARLVLSYPPERRLRVDLVLLPLVLGLTAAMLAGLAVRARRRDAAALSVAEG